MKKGAAYTIFTLILAAAIILILKPSRESQYACSNCNLVVILIDTLRADHIPPYGYVRNTAPFLTKLAEKSLVFDRAFSSSSWTAPATASIFTSMYPSRHGVVTGFAASKKLQQENQQITMNRIPKDVVTMPEFLIAAGFQTAAVADNLNIGKEMGFDRGFEKFIQFRYEGAPAVNSAAIKFLDEMNGKGKYFIYLHYMEPHSPHYEREPFYSECIRTTSTNKRDLMQCAYDSEIRYVDEHIEKLFLQYKWLENSVVVVLADHGEEFWEHGRTGHGRTLYSEVIRVPLIVYHPKLKAGARAAQNVNTIDLLPTLAEIIGRETPSNWQGMSLFTAQDSTQSNDRAIFSEKLRHPSTTRQRWWKRAVVRGNWHYIQTEEPEKITLQELFDLATDFTGLSSVFDKHRSVADQLSTILKENPHNTWEKYKESFDLEVDKEMLNNLKSLGYVD